MVQAFATIGLGQWFRYLTGGIEVVSGDPAADPGGCASCGAAALAATMIGAIITHLFIIGGNPAPAIVLLAFTTTIAWLRDEVTDERADRDGGRSTQTRLDEDSLNQLFAEARTHNRWLDRPVDEALLRELYDLARLAPTSANSQPMRVVFVRSRDAKERLKPALAPQNVEKTMTAPVTAIIAHDLEFYEKLPKLMPHVDARSWFARSCPAEQIERAASQGSSMQGAYLILAARALGLDAGPIGGFDAAKVDAAFFPGSAWRSNFLVNLGLRRSRRAVSAEPPAGVRRGVPDRLIG